MKNTFFLILTAFGLVFLITLIAQPELPTHAIIVNRNSSNTDFRPPFPCSRAQILHTLLQPGGLAFWDTGATNFTENTIFDPQRQRTTSHQKGPLFTGADLDPRRLSIARDPHTGENIIIFAMKPGPARRLAHFTSQNIGNYLTITFERIVLLSPIIQSELPGSAQIPLTNYAAARLCSKIRPI